MKKNLSTSELFIVASVLFGMFFGAGNLIFPIHMGQLAGFNVVKAVAGFIITAVSLPILGVCALGVTKTNDMQELSSKVGKVYSVFFTVILYLTIGPFFAIPRCATTSFTIGIAPFIVSKEKEPFALLIFSLIFFIVVLLFSFKPRKIVTYIGKYINPLFLTFFILFLMIVLSQPTIDIFDVLPEAEYDSGSFLKGLFEGYNTMDAIASLAFGITIIQIIKKFGIEDSKDISFNIFKSGIICGILMSIIYFLTSLIGVITRGAVVVSENGGIAFADITKFYFGDIGIYILLIIVTLACVKTSIALIVSCSEMFYKLCKGIIPERLWIIIFVVLSFIISNFGLNIILQYSLVALIFIYPLVISLIILSLIGSFFEYHSIVFKTTTFCCFIAAFFDMINSLPKEIILRFNFQVLINFAEKYIPFFNIGLGFVIPTLVGFIVGFIYNELFVEDEHTETY